MSNLKSEMMKKYILLLMVGLSTFGCNGQKNGAKDVVSEAEKSKVGDKPNSTWKVDKEYDENGNLVKYDSIYSWSSEETFDNLSPVARDSLLQSFKSRFFTNYAEFENQGFDDVFSQDSLFSKFFFNDDFFGSDFGNDFLDIDKIRQQMIERQMEFLEKYQSEFNAPKDEN